MDTEKQKPIPVSLDRPTEHNIQIVYAIPAKPKPELWWKRKFGAVIVLIYCVVMIGLIYGSK